MGLVAGSGLHNAQYYEDYKVNINDSSIMTITDDPTIELPLTQ